MTPHQHSTTQQDTYRVWATLPDEITVGPKDRKQGNPREIAIAYAEELAIEARENQLPTEMTELAPIEHWLIQVTIAEGKDRGITVLLEPLEELTDKHWNTQKPRKAKHGGGAPTGNYPTLTACIQRIGSLPLEGTTPSREAQRKILLWIATTAYPKTRTLKGFHTLCHETDLEQRTAYRAMNRLTEAGLATKDGERIALTAKALGEDYCEPHEPLELGVLIETRNTSEDTNPQTPNSHA